MSIFKNAEFKLLKGCVFFFFYSQKQPVLYCFPNVFFLSPAAALMHKFNAHAATDITGFGIIGHARNLAQQQKNDVAFVIHNLPIISKMAAISKAGGNLFGLLHGTSSETSGESHEHNWEPIMIVITLKLHWNLKCLNIICFGFLHK